MDDIWYQLLFVFGSKISNKSFQCHWRKGIRYFGLSTLHEKLPLCHACFCDAKEGKIKYLDFFFLYRTTKCYSSFYPGIRLKAVSVNWLYI